MRIRKRLEAIEQLLRMDQCAVCASGDYDVAIFPNGWGTEPRLNGRDEPFPDNCPGCGRWLLDPSRPIKFMAGFDPSLV